MTVSRPELLYLHWMRSDIGVSVGVTYTGKCVNMLDLVFIIRRSGRNRSSGSLSVPHTV